MKFSMSGVLGFAMVVSPLLSLAACGAATDVQSADRPTSLPLIEPTTTAAAGVDVESTSSSPPTPDATALPETTEPPSSSSTAPTTAAEPATTTAAPSTAPTTAPVDVNAPFCLAASSIEDLGTSVSLDDRDAAGRYFEQQAELWAAAVPVAPFVIAADVVTVAAFVDELGVVMAANDYDLVAAFADVTALEAQLGSDAARIRVDQFVDLTCDVEPTTSADATAVFYIGLLETVEGQSQLAEILAAAEVFPLDGARCFVERVTSAAVYPLVGAASTAAQDQALADVLNACQLTIGATS